MRTGNRAGEFDYFNFIKIYFYFKLFNLLEPLTDRFQAGIFFSFSTEIGSCFQADLIPGM